MIIIRCCPLIYETDIKANGNNKYGVLLMIIFHCRPIYGTGKGAKNGGFSQNCNFSEPMVLVQKAGRSDDHPAFKLLKYLIINRVYREWVGINDFKTGIIRFSFDTQPFLKVFGRQ